MQLVYHIQAGEKKWIPSSPKIRQAMEFVRGLLWEKINVLIDFPTSQGGTTSTANVVRTCFQRVNDSNNEFYYWILRPVYPINHFFNKYCYVLNEIFSVDSCS